MQEQFSVQIFCPNCGHKNAGRLLSNGGVSMQCGRCRCVLVSKKMRDNHRYILKVNKN